MLCTLTLRVFPGGMFRQLQGYRPSPLSFMLGQLPSTPPTLRPCCPRSWIWDLHWSFWPMTSWCPASCSDIATHLLLLWQAWLCGGSVEILPCSRVGHIYQSQGASSRTDPEAILRNKVRIAETWLGPFKETFYRHIPEAFALSKVRRGWWESLANIRPPA